MKRIAIIGGGASGMMAGISASLSGNFVDLYESNEKLGKKIYITGKGRCNLTNNCDRLVFFNNVVSNSKFIYSCFSEVSNQFIINFFEKNGLKLKVERGNRVFPESDKASDVIKTLEKLLIKQGVNVKLNTRVSNLLVENNMIKGLIVNDDKIYYDSVIVCTGGISYQATGSTGDGYNFAKIVGHKIITPVAGLSAIKLQGNDFAELQGLSLKNVKISCFNNDKRMFSDFGEMLFTHFGVSGPIVLTMSSYINRENLKNLTISIDLKPALNVETLNARLLREFLENNSKNISSVMRSLVPSSLINLILRRANINPGVKCSEITKKQRFDLINVLKGLTFRVKELFDINQAIITSGGVSVKEINPKTMESKLVNGLFFAGEVLDVDALTGGFNLQIAFSTGYVAGKNA